MTYFSWAMWELALLSPGPKARQGVAPPGRAGFSQTSRIRGPKDRHSGARVAPSALPFSYAFLFPALRPGLRTAGPSGLGALKYVSVIANSTTKCPVVIC